MSNHVRAWKIAATACVVTLALAGRAPVESQGISAIDAKEAARFGAVVSAAARAGFTGPQVVGHGTAAADEFFALLATRDGKGVLVIASDANRPTPSAPVEIERDETPAQIGVRGVQFGAFLDTPGLYDIVVTHEPFMLETSFRAETHHILRRLGTTMALVCTFPGNSNSSTSKGIGSLSNARRVTVESAMSGARIGFVVKAVDETTQTEGRPGSPASVSRTETSTSYELPASGACQSSPAQVAAVISF